MWADFFQNVGSGFAYLVVWVLCGAGVVLSCLSISGTWLVVLAAALAAILSGPAFPGWWTVILFALLSAGCEAFESVAGVWGVTRRGGSGWAGFAAVVGGLLGMILGGVVIPIPVLGSLVGMLAGSFALAYVAERHRLKRADHAAHIARGAVVARIMVMLVKLGATLAMILWLAIGTIAAHG